MKAETYVERTLAPIQRVVTPTLAELSPARLAEVVERYRHELADLANRLAFPSAAWALEAMDVLVSDNERLQREVARMTAELRPVATRASARQLATAAKQRPPVPAGDGRARS